MIELTLKSGGKVGIAPAHIVSVVPAETGAKVITTIGDIEVSESFEKVIGRANIAKAAAPPKTNGAGAGYY